ncbi:MAG: hypothetical protein JWN71_2062 [Xanthobacteraceae bacterium]|nr:hypothetical protein [Xanthobacteraceae bacterium]
MVRKKVAKGAGKSPARLRKESIVSHIRQSRSTAWIAATALLAPLCGIVSSTPALAQGKLEARFTASLAGVPLGKGAWVIDIAEDQYTAAASGATSGLMRVVANGEGTSASRGFMVSGQPVPASYGASVTSEKKTEEVRMSLAQGNVRDFAVLPPAPPNPERIPVTDTHRKGVLDPMTASLVRVTGTGDPLTPEACNRAVSVFDGRLRYDLKLAYKRMDKVKADKGYDGAAVVCSVYFTPVAGYIPDRPAIKYLSELKTMEVWLAPVAGTRVLVPFRIAIPTPLGLGVLQATQFVSVAQAGRPTTATNVKTQ